MPSPKEQHKLTVLWNGRQYAVVSHSVEKDETLQVYIRRGLAEVISHGRPEFSFVL